MRQWSLAIVPTLIVACSGPTSLCPMPGGTVFEHTAKLTLDREGLKDAWTGEGDIAVNGTQQTFTFAAKQLGVAPYASAMTTQADNPATPSPAPPSAAASSSSASAMPSPSASPVPNPVRVSARHLAINGTFSGKAPQQFTGAVTVTHISATDVTTTELSDSNSKIYLDTWNGAERFSEPSPIAMSGHIEGKDAVTGKPFTATFQVTTTVAPSCKP